MRTLIISLLLTSTLAAQSTTWYAVLEAGDQAIPVNIVLEEVEGSLQSPQQLETRLPFSEYTRTADSLYFTVAPAGLSFRGAVYRDSIAGEFRQGAFATSLAFYPDPPAGYLVQEPTDRPQDPSDFPYRREEVNFAGGAAGVKLVGELTLPAADTPPRALIVLVSGSGPQDRNSDLGPPINHRPFLVLSDNLTRRGYGVLRYDERGVGASTGDFARATSGDFADDAAAAVRYLRGREELTGLPMGIAGHSEGGLIAPIVAARHDGLLDFAVLLAAPGHPIDTLMLQQRRDILGSTPLDESVVRDAYRYTKENIALDSATYSNGLREVITAALATLPDSVRSAVANPEDYLEDYVFSFNTPWMRYFIAYDPALYLSQVTVPVLAINGELDRQVSVDNLEAVGAALERAGNGEVTLIRVPGVNHLLQPATTGAPTEYGQIETTIAPVVLEHMGAWLDERFGG